jgi:hypothetical protein
MTDKMAKYSYNIEGKRAKFVKGHIVLRSVKSAKNLALKKKSIDSFPKSLKISREEELATRRKAHEHAQHATKMGRRNLSEQDEGYLVDKGHY